MLLARTITTVDSHTEGNPTRVVTGGVAIPPGETIEARWQWARSHLLDLLHFLNNEPRGSGMMCSVLLMPPCSAKADFSILILEPQELVPMCGHCVIGAATTVVSIGMVRVTAPSTEVAFETPAGLVSCSVAVEQGSVGPVSLQNVPSFVLHHSAEVRVDGYGSVPVDVAFGGDFYAIVDADLLGIAVDPARTRPMVDFAARLIPAVNEQLAIRHPTRPDIDRCYEAMLTTAARRRAPFRHAVVSPPGDMDRSPCGTGTSARLALLHALGETSLGQRLDFEGLLCTTFGATVSAVTTVGVIPAIVPTVSGRAWITGFNALVLDREDPFPTGYRLS